MDSLPFRILRRLGSLPSVLILLGLLLGGISAAQSIANAINEYAIVHLVGGGTVTRSVGR